MGFGTRQGENDLEQLLLRGQQKEEKKATKTQSARSAQINGGEGRRAATAQREGSSGLGSRISGSTSSPRKKGKSFGLLDQGHSTKKEKKKKKAKIKKNEAAPCSGGRRTRR